MYIYIYIYIVHALGRDACRPAQRIRSLALAFSVYKNRARSRRSAEPPDVKIGSPAKPPTTVFRENASAVYIYCVYF